MRLVMAIGVGSFLVASTVVGLRMLLLAARTRRSAELEMGLALLVPGAFGYAAALASAADPATTGLAQSTLRALANSCFGIGAISLALFTRQVFRPESLAAGCCVAVVCTSIGASSLGFWIERADDLLASPAFWVSYVARISVFGWAAFEAFHQYRLGRRRERLGLADPLLVNRFLLWGLGNGAVLGILALQLSVMASLGLDAMFLPLVMTPISALGLVAAITVWLTFLPPRAYRQRFGQPGEPQAV
jgi:hypothetical protein